MATTLNESYTLGLKREIVEALRSVFGETFPIEQWRPSHGRGVRVSWEYPREAIHYPSIYISYTEGPIRNMGLGHYERDVDELGNEYHYGHWQFEGQLNFNILTLNPADRDSLAAALVTILGPGQYVEWAKTFYGELQDADYVLVQLNRNEIQPGGFTTGDVPWNNPDEQTFAASYHMQVFGELFTDPTTGDLIAISDVEVYPYTQGSPRPW